MQRIAVFASFAAFGPAHGVRKSAPVVGGQLTLGAEVAGLPLGRSSLAEVAADVSSARPAVDATRKPGGGAAPNAPSSKLRLHTGVSSTGISGPSALDENIVWETPSARMANLLLDQRDQEAALRVEARQEAVQEEVPSDTPRSVRTLIKVLKPGIAFVGLQAGERAAASDSFGMHSRFMPQPIARHSQRLPAMTMRLASQPHLPESPDLSLDAKADKAVDSQQVVDALLQSSSLAEVEADIASAQPAVDSSTTHRHGSMTASRAHLPRSSQTADVPTTEKSAKAARLVGSAGPAAFGQEKPPLSSRVAIALQESQERHWAKRRKASDVHWNEEELASESRAIRTLAKALRPGIAFVGMQAGKRLVSSSSYGMHSHLPEQQMAHIEHRRPAMTMRSAPGRSCRSRRTCCGARTWTWPPIASRHWMPRRLTHHRSATSACCPS